jgi:ATP-dependent Clp protease protease subunit
MAKNEIDQEAVLSMYDVSSLESLGVHMFFGEVDTESARAAADFILKSNLLYPDDRALTMFLNTCGGECHEGFAVLDLMDSSRLPIATVGIGQIASMGVLLLSGGTHGLRTITKSSEVMAHQFSASVGGKQHELVATTKSLKMLEDRFYSHFLRHTKLSKAKIKDILFSPSDRYLTPAECKKYGLVDKVVDYISNT